MPAALAIQPWAAARRWLGAALFAAFVAYCLHRLEFSLERIWAGMGKLGWLVALMLPPEHGGFLAEFAWAALETLAVAFCGTLLAAVPAMPLGFLGARGMLPGWMARFALRRGFDVLRGVDTLIWGLVFVSALGLGPFAGVLAIAVGDLGVLAKLYAEAVEAVDRRPVEGVRAAGGNALEVARFGVLPQVLPVFLGNALYYLESNTRAASILGIVGGGGLGLQLSDRIRANEWQQVAFLLLLLLALVSLLDAVSGRLRARLMRGRSVPVPLPI